MTRSLLPNIFHSSHHVQREAAGAEPLSCFPQEWAVLTLPLPLLCMYSCDTCLFGLAKTIHSFSFSFSRKTSSSSSVTLCGKKRKVMVIIWVTVCAVAILALDLSLPFSYKASFYVGSVRSNIGHKDSWIYYATCTFILIAICMTFVFSGSDGWILLRLLSWSVGLKVFWSFCTT